MTRTADGIVAHVGLGSNLDDPARQVRTAIAALGCLPRTRLLAASRLYRSAPWGVTAQPEFVNAVAAVATTLAPEVLLGELLAIERGRGRVRGGPRWGPRVLDLDLLLYGDLRHDSPGLTIPHPQLAARAFVLLPLTDIAPDLVVPGQGPVRALLARLDTGDCVPFD